MRRLLEGAVGQGRHASMQRLAALPPARPPEATATATLTAVGDVARQVASRGLAVGARVALSRQAGEGGGSGTGRQAVVGSRRQHAMRRASLEHKDTKPPPTTTTHAARLTVQEHGASTGPGSSVCSSGTARSRRSAPPTAGCCSRPPTSCPGATRPRCWATAMARATTSTASESVLRALITIHARETDRAVDPLQYSQMDSD